MIRAAHTALFKVWHRDSFLQLRDIKAHVRRQESEGKKERGGREREREGKERGGKEKEREGGRKEKG